MKRMSIMIHLREIHIHQPEGDRNVFPWNVPAIHAINVLTFQKPVTVLVGENGSGKSTLLEAIARAAGSITVGSDGASQDETLVAVQPLVNALRMVWNQRTHRGFFLRAEDFFGYIKRLRKLRQSMLDELDRIDRDYEGRSENTKSLVSWPAISSLYSLDQHYGKTCTQTLTGRINLQFSNPGSSPVVCICWTNRRLRFLLFDKWD